MIIEIGRKEIDNGEPDSTDSCPIALKLTELGGNHLEVQHNELTTNEFYKEGGEIAYKEKLVICKLPLEANKFVTEFDATMQEASYVTDEDGDPLTEAFTEARKQFEPFSFHLSAECFMR